MNTKSLTMQGPSFAASAFHKLLIAGACFSLVAIVHAQTPAATTDDETITLGTFKVSTNKDVGYRAGNAVSATRIDTPIKDLPFAVSAFTQQFITDTGARDLFDVAQYSAGVTSAGREFTGGNSLYAIRGFNQAPQRNGFQTANSGQASGPYVDTVDIERVEVVKGPASLLYGQVAPGGIVNYITKTPEKGAFASVTGKIGSYDYWRTELDVNQPLIGDTLLFRLNGAYENNFEYYAHAKSKTTVYDPTLTWNITKRLSLTLDYESFRRLESTPAQFLPNIEIVTAANGSTAALSNKLDLSDPGFLGYYPLPKTFNYSGAHDYRRDISETANAELDAKLTDHWTSRANFSWFKSDYSQKLTGIGAADVFPGVGVDPVAYAASVLANPNNALQGGPGYTAILQRRERFQKTMGNGGTAQFEATGKYNWSWGKIQPLVGALYNQSVQWTETRQLTAPASTNWNLNDPTTWVDNPADWDPNALPYVSPFNRSESQNEAAYGVITGTFLQNRLYTVAGFRYSEAASQTASAATFPAGVNPTLANVGLGGSRATFDKGTPQAGIGYKITKDLLVFANYSQSFQANSFLQSSNVVTTPAKPTTSEGWETGVKTDFLNGRISSTVSVYTIKQKDRVVTLNNIVGGTTFVSTFQGTEDRSNGVEAEITFSPMDNWQIFVSGAEDDVRTIAVPTGLGYYLGAHPEATAKTLANLWTRYTLASGPLKGLWIGGGFNYTGQKAQRLNNKALFLPATTLWNSALGYDWNVGKIKMSAVLNWENMTNEVYYPANQQLGLPERIVASVTIKY